MKRLDETFLFEITNSVVDYKKQIAVTKEKMNEVKLSELEYQIGLIKRRYNYPIKHAILKSIDDLELVPVFNKNKIFLPVYIPTIGYAEDGVVKVLVNLTPWSIINKAGGFEIDGRRLFSLFQSAYISKKIVESPWNKFSLNTTVSKYGAIIYSKMFTKLIDKMYGITINPMESDKIRFLSASFYLVNMLEREDNERTGDIAFQSINGYITRNIADQLASDSPKDRYDSIDKFITSLNGIGNIKDINTRIFLQEWIKMFGEASLFALEYFPFFLFTIFSVYINSHIVNDYLIEPLISVELNNLYNEVVKLIR
jgi:hypothetical protein